MYQLKLQMSDKAYEHLSYMIRYIPEIDIIEEIREDKKVDEEGFEVVKPNQLFKELGTHDDVY